MELLEDMSTKSFIQAFVRFSNINGVPKSLYSDNYTSFIAGGEILEDIMTSSEFTDKFSSHSIKHKRIPVSAAWVGSTWERHIRTIKSCLHKVFGRAKTKYFDMITAMSDIQNVINSRPLTYRVSSEDDLDIITPKMFLTQGQDSIIIRAEDKPLLDADPIAREDILKTLEIREKILNKFRDLYYKEYLVSLVEQCNALHDQIFENRIKKDDVVLIKVPNKSRPHWTLGRVGKLLPGKDNKVRFVVVKSKGREHTHAICHLYPLELSLTHNYNPKGINKRIKAKTTPKNTRNKSSCKQKGKTTKGKANNSLKATQPPSSKLPPRTNRGKHKEDPAYYYDDDNEYYED